MLALAVEDGPEQLDRGVHVGGPDVLIEASDDRFEWFNLISTRCGSHVGDSNRDVRISGAPPQHLHKWLPRCLRWLRRGRAACGLPFYNPTQILAHLFHIS